MQRYVDDYRKQSGFIHIDELYAENPSIFVLDARFIFLLKLVQITGTKTNFKEP